MPSKKEIRETLNTLNNGNFHIECPNCHDETSLNSAGLFHLDNFSPEALEIYKEMLASQKARRAQLRSEKIDIPKSSEIGAKATNLGFILERLAPTLDGFTFDKNDCRSMFDPIDYVIFEGMSKMQKVSKVVFVDIKTGGATLTAKQRKIKKVVDDKQVTFEVYES